MAKAPPGASASVSAPTSTAASLATVARLEKQASGSSDLNALVDLLNLLQTASNKSKVRCSAANALHNVFSTLIRQGRLIGKVKETQASSQSLEAVRSWAKARWTEYTDTLCALLAGSDEMLAVCRSSCYLPPERTDCDLCDKLLDGLAQYAHEPPTNYFRAPITSADSASILLRCHSMAPHRGRAAPHGRDANHRRASRVRQSLLKLQRRRPLLFSSGG